MGRTHRQERIGYPGNNIPATGKLWILSVQNRADIKPFSQDTRTETSILRTETWTSYIRTWKNHKVFFSRWIVNWRIRSYPIWLTWLRSAKSLFVKKIPYCFSANLVIPSKGSGNGEIDEPRCLSIDVMFEQIVKSHVISINERYFNFCEIYAVKLEKIAY